MDEDHKRPDQVEPCEEDEEKEHFRKILNAFRYYRTHALQRVHLAVASFKSLPERHQLMLPQFPNHIQNVRHCINHNYEIVKLIAANTHRMFENKEEADEKENSQNDSPPASSFDMDKLKTTIKQFVRDWSAEGQSERDRCYKPVLDEIKQRFPPEKCDPAEVSVLVPGAGLGRLAYEVAKAGYICQGNEFSLFMLFASHFVLNRCSEEEGFTIYPWVHQWCNNKQSADQIQPVRFPNVSPSLPDDANFSMAAGDFLEVYTEPDSWDCVASVFFLDTAHNVIQYIEAMYHIIKPGGYLISLGPLLWHYAGLPNEMSLELSYQDVRSVLEQCGFQILKEDLSVRCSYTQNPNSMMQYEYDCVYFVAQKPLHPQPNPAHPATDDDLRTVVINIDKSRDPRQKTLPHENHNVVKNEGEDEEEEEEEEGES